MQPLSSLSWLAAATALAIATPATAGHDLTLDELKIGNPVFASDGVRIGEIDRIKADSDGSVIEIDIAKGEKPDLAANVIVVKPTDIASTDDTATKLTLSSADADKLPLVKPGTGG